MIYGYFKPAPVPRARADYITFTAVFYADTDRKDNSAVCRSAPKSLKS
ncbi:MAG: hypothetical protein MJ100_11070 [Ruminococcus sp.]|nr:hypothetical protein [Ruminococcus sp.]